KIVTVNTNGKNCKRGYEMNDLNVLTDSMLLLQDGKILDCLPNSAYNKLNFDKTIDLEGKCILPGLIDCHTHTIFAGSRANEFKLKLGGATYEEIAAAGGGIANTTLATRNASKSELIAIGKKWLAHFASLGITTVEIKSGYGLNEHDEIKMLQVIDELKKSSPLDIVSTYLGAHIVPGEYKLNRSAYIDLICQTMLPRIAASSLADFCDVFCESSAYSAGEMKLILETAKSLGIKPRAHIEQFNRIGGLEVALSLGAISVDHLEVMDANGIGLLSGSETVGVVLPGCSLFLKCAYAPARKIIDSGGLLAIATDFNPGSSHIPNLPLVLSLGALNMKLTIEEVISAATINAAKVLGRETITGSIEPGKTADLLILDSEEYTDLIYTIGKNMTYMTIKNGNIIYTNKHGLVHENN
ncbi:MAG: imidazolonepropionase, partial [Ignavibacteriales bacterium]|nr:imidazolonepropionase [Ignavibacteriales bacterium]